MNRRLISVFVFALIVASLTSFVIYRLIVLRVPTSTKPTVSNRIVVASHDLQVGALIREEDLSVVISSGSIPASAIKTKTDAAGRGVIATIYQNEPILEQRLAPRGAGAGLAATIPMGKRAVALRVNEVVGLAGFVLPGMRVDVLVAGNAPGRDTTLCRTVLQNIEVLSAGQKIEKNIDGKPEQAQVVNLLVTPDQAEVLNLASSETKVQLVLRNPLDTQEQVTHGTSIAGLFGVSESKPAVAPAAFNPPLPVRPRAAVAPAHEPEVATIEVFNGAKRSEQKFEISKEEK